jgi:hypothetical protein
MDRQKASNAVVANVDLYAGLLAEAEAERVKAQEALSQAIDGLGEWRKYFDQIREAVEEFSPSLKGGIGSYAALALATQAVLRQAEQKGEYVREVEERLERCSLALSDLLRAMAPVTMPLTIEEKIGRVSEKVAAMQAHISKPRLVLPRGSFQVQVAAVALVQALGDKHALSGALWGKLTAAVEALGRPGLGATVHAAERALLGAAKNLGTAWGAETQSDVTRFRQAVKALVEAEARQELARVRKRDQVVGEYVGSGET